jgi:hypothetical protein
MLYQQAGLILDGLVFQNQALAYVGAWVAGKGPSGQRDGGLAVEQTKLGCRNRRGNFETEFHREPGI